MQSRQSNSLSTVLLVLFACFIFKIILSVYFPLTGDEAYYQIWGQNLSWGYYDHTPFIGWFLYPFLLISHSQVMLRLPTLLVSSIIGLCIYLFLRSYDDQKALLLSILFFISPINLLGVLITTDIPLILFSFLSGMFLFTAIKRHDHLGFYFLAGLCLGLAFFSKYFAVLLALSYFLYFIFSRKSWKRTLGFIIIFLCVLPFGIQNLYWNYTHGWANILFNVYHRNEGVHLQWHYVLLYLLIIIYIMTPIIFYYFCKHGKKIFSKPEHIEFSILTWSFLLPLLFFLGLSTIKSIGLHWPLSFIPFIYVLALIYLSQTEIKRCLKFMVWFAGVHVVLLAILIFMPVTFWQHLGFKGHKYADLVFVMKHPEIRATLNTYENDYVIASPSYAKADLMIVDSGIYSPTFGMGSVHGREGDFLTNYKDYQNKNFVIFLTDKPKWDRIKPFFSMTKLETFTQYGATFYLVFGYKFNFVKYRQLVLAKINERYWQVPDYLPYTETFYCKRYFKVCPARPI